MENEHLQQLLDKGIAAFSDGDSESAIKLYKEILTQKEDWAAPNYNLGLVYKYQGKWEESFKYNKRAVELNREDESAWWNLGIAATALKEWRMARGCWNFFGMKYDDLDEEPDGEISITPIRLNPDGDAEVVWAMRIDPARAILENIPLPESGHRYKDMVLNDGAPKGYREWDGREYPVFDELQLLSKSDYQTFSIKCRIEDQAHFELLAERCEKADIFIENWTTGIRILCAACSLGTPHEHHDEELKEKNSDDLKLIAFASKSETDLTEILKAWSEETGIDLLEYHFY